MRKANIKNFKQIKKENGRRTAINIQKGYSPRGAIKFYVVAEPHWSTIRLKTGPAKSQSRA